MVKMLSQTPTWVFGLFVALLALGWTQARTRRVGRILAFALPAGMIAISVAGLQSSFGIRIEPLAAWATGLVLAACVGYAKFRDRRVDYDVAAERFVVPGSWMPLAIIMSIFLVKYAYAVLRAFDAGVISSPFFVAALSGVYGVLSGYFAARALNLVAVLRASTGAQC